ncbi:MAG: hypothetical protein JJU45_08050 [Acidimicrobiia bacterium]|nr:hypothetical protein [Acidimicrobiia bacterium]
MSAAAGGPPPRPLSDAERKVFRRAGIDTEAEMRAWIAAGIGPYEAESFCEAGVDDVATAARWRSEGMSGGYLLAAKRAGLDDDEARARHGAGKPPVDPDPAVGEESPWDRYPELDETTDRHAAALEVSAREFANLAGATDTSIVAHWRKSSKSGETFPRALSSGRDPHYGALEVIGFLRHQKRLSKHQPDGTWYWRQAIAGLPAATSHGGDALRPYVVALVVLGTLQRRAEGLANVVASLEAASRSSQPAGYARETIIAAVTTAATHDDDEELAALLESAVSNVAVNPPVLAAALHGLDEALAKGADPNDLLDTALDTLDAVTPGSPVTVDALTEVFAGLVDDAPTNCVVCDPACGEGAVLRAVARRRHTAHLVGVERAHAPWVVAKLRFWLDHATGAPTPTDVELLELDAVLDTPLDHRTFDVVVIDPPVTGRKGPQHRHWFDLIDRTLTATGTAAVLSPSRLLEAPNPTARIDRITPKLGAGGLTSVVFLPANLQFGSRQPLALCILTGDDHPTRQHDTIAVIDLTRATIEPTPPDGDTAPPSTAATNTVRSAQIRQTLHLWLTAGATTPTVDKVTKTLGWPKVTIVDGTQARHEGLAPDRAGDLPPEAVDLADQLASLLEAHPDVTGTTTLRSALDRFLRSKRPKPS